MDQIKATQEYKEEVAAMKAEFKAKELEYREELSVITPVLKHIKDGQITDAEKDVIASAKEYMAEYPTNTFTPGTSEYGEIRRQFIVPQSEINHPHLIEKLAGEVETTISEEATKQVIFSNKMTAMIETAIKAGDKKISDTDKPAIKTAINEALYMASARYEKEAHKNESNLMNDLYALGDPHPGNKIPAKKPAPVIPGHTPQKHGK